MKMPNSRNAESCIEQQQKWEALMKGERKQLASIQQQTRYFDRQCYEEMNSRLFETYPSSVPPLLTI
jgi:hypothetical protein